MQHGVKDYPVSTQPTLDFGAFSEGGVRDEGFKGERDGALSEVQKIRVARTSFARSVSAVAKVVTRTITDGRTDDRTMAAGSSVTWTHYSVRYKVTWG
jgi:hypothetical protein